MTNTPGSHRSRPPLTVLAEGVEGIVRLVTSIALWPFLRPLLLNWGASAEEIVMKWPGDTVLPRSTSKVTRAITIAAPAAQVWPWLLQIGRRRGGFYSYELLENLAGFRVHNLEHIVSEFQTLEHHQFIELHPSGMGLWVEHLEREKHLVFRNWFDPDDIETRQLSALRTWGFHLVSESPSTSRLIVHACNQVRLSNWRLWLLSRFVEEPLDFVMETKMLRKIRQLSEQTVALNKGTQT